jgi:hypothetical protein
MDVLDSQVRPRASWHLYNPKRGSMLQHYPFDEIAWHTGSRAAWGMIGIESEGRAGEPLTPSQNANLTEFFIWAKANFGWTELTRDVTLFEHNFFRATSCPSDRILWDVIIPKEEEKEEGKVIWILYAREDDQEDKWVTDLIQRYPIEEDQVPRYRYLGAKGPHAVPADFLESIPYGYEGPPALMLPDNEA